MYNAEIFVHGSIFFLLKKFVVNSYTPEMWLAINREAGTSGEYDITKNYSLYELESIIAVASRHSGYSVHQLKEIFGKYLVPDLFTLYKNYLKPEWKTFDVLIHTELVMHGAVRKLNSTANPPILNVSRVHDQLIIIDYYSKRKMGALAVGIIKGIAEFFGEEQNIEVTPTSNPDDERVQIRVSFT